MEKELASLAKAGRLYLDSAEHIARYLSGTEREAEIAKLLANLQDFIRTSLACSARADAMEKLALQLTIVPDLNLLKEYERLDSAHSGTTDDEQLVRNHELFQSVQQILARTPNPPTEEVPMSSLALSED